MTINTFLAIRRHPTHLAHHLSPTDSTDMICCHRFCILMTLICFEPCCPDLRGIWLLWCAIRRISYTGIWILWQWRPATHLLRTQFWTKRGPLWKWRPVWNWTVDHFKHTWNVFRLAFCVERSDNAGPSGSAVFKMCGCKIPARGLQQKYQD